MRVILRNLLLLAVCIFAPSIAVAEMYEAMENMSVHDFPDRGAAQVGTIKKGEPVKVKQKAGAWLRVSDYENTPSGRKAKWVRDGSLKSFADIEKERVAREKEEERRRLAEEARIRKEEEASRRALSVKTPAAGSYIATLSERAVRASLKDPSSAQFRNQFLLTPHGTQIPNFCGEVNAKNSWGAYTGFKRFASVGNYVAIDDGSVDFNDTWSRLCM